MSHWIILAMLVCGGLAATLKRNQFVGFVLSPMGLFTAVYFAIYFFLPLFGSLGVNVQLWQLFSEVSPAAIRALSCLVLYYAAVVAGVHLVGIKNDTLDLYDRLLSSEGTDLRFQMIVLGGFLLVGAAVSFYVESTSGFHAALQVLSPSEALARRISLTAGWGYARAPLFSATALLILGYISLLRTRSRQGKVLHWAFLVAIVAINAVSLSGTAGRLPVLIPILYLSFVAVVLSPRTKIAFRLVAALLVAIGLFVVVSQLGKFRRTLMGQTLSEGENMILVELAASFSQAEHLVFVMEHSHEWLPARGQTYIAGMLMPIPRSLWPDKPVGGGPMLANIVRPGSYAVGQEINSSRTTGAPLEAYLNFEMLGIIPLGILHGLGLAAVTWYSRRVHEPYQFVVYFVSLFALAEMLVYGEFAGVLGRYGSMILPLLLLAWGTPFLRRVQTNRA